MPRKLLLRETGQGQVHVDSKGKAFDGVVPRDLDPGDEYEIELVPGKRRLAKVAAKEITPMGHTVIKWTVQPEVIP